MARSLVLAVAMFALARTTAAQTPAAAPPPAQPWYISDPPPPPTPAAAQATPAPAPVVVAPAPVVVAPHPPAAPDPKLLTWLSLGGAWGFSESYFVGTLGGARLLKANIGFTFELQYAAGGTTSYSPWLLPVRAGFAWFTPTTTSRLRPYVGAHYVLLNGDSFDWDSGAGARLGFSVPLGELRVNASRTVATRLTAFVTYDHAFNCHKGCDLWAPQVGVLF